MSDTFESDPNRILFGCSIGSLQAWPAAEGDTCLCFSFYADFNPTGGRLRSYTSISHNLTAEDARGLAAALIRAADHADAVKTQPAEKAA